MNAWWIISLMLCVAGCAAWEVPTRSSATFEQDWSACQALGVQQGSRPASFAYSSAAPSLGSRLAQAIPGVMEMRRCMQERATAFALYSPEYP